MWFFVQRGKNTHFLWYDFQNFCLRCPLHIIHQDLISVLQLVLEIVTEIEKRVKICASFDPSPTQYSVIVVSPIRQIMSTKEADALIYFKNRKRVLKQSKNQKTKKQINTYKKPGFTSANMGRNTAAENMNPAPFLNSFFP